MNVMAAKSVELRVVTSEYGSTAEVVVKLKKAVSEALVKGARVNSYSEALGESNTEKLDAPCDAEGQP